MFKKINLFKACAQGKILQTLGYKKNYCTEKFSKEVKENALSWRANLADQNKQKPQKIKMRITYHT